MSTLLVITGTTASGKTGAALELARRLDGELVGCDSVQVYRGLDIGSAKPTAEELGGVPHHLLDVVEPDAAIDAMQYAALADAAIADIVGRGRLPIVVGGTGLWLRALLRGLVALPAPDPVLRARLDAEVAQLGTPAMHARLRAVDPLAAEGIHPHDAMRIVRALEVLEQTGVPLGTLRAAHALGAPRHRALVVALDRPRDELYARIDARIDAMLDAGWLDETRGLCARHGPGIRALGSVGYRELVAHLRDGVAWTDTVAAIRKSTRVYTRRQRTWIGSDPDVTFHATPASLLGPEGDARISHFLEDSGR